MGGSKENIYDFIDELSIKAAEDITGEPCNEMGVPQDTIRLSSDTIEVDTISEPLDGVAVPLDDGGNESDYQEIMDYADQNSAYAHLYSTLPLRWGEGVDPQNQNKVDATKTKWDGEDTAVQWDGEEEVEESRDEQEMP